jgi:hypothetical protein
MNKISIYTLKVLCKIYTECFGTCMHNLPRETDPDKSSYMIYNLLASDKPCMIARFGSTEFCCLLNYISIHANDHSIIKYIKGQSYGWWWNKNIMSQMQNWSGFFPPTEEKLSQFCELMLSDIEQLDLLGSWIPQEYHIKDKILNIPKISLLCLEPYWAKNPWSRILNDKKVLVIHPFAKLIEKQYAINRTRLFKDSNVLPLFHLETTEAIQSLGGKTNGFKDWFEALFWMEKEIDKHDYDIALIGCGAYGFPLAAHAKRMGKKAVHLGGALQLLFGIKGKRWEDPNYGVSQWNLSPSSYLNLMNEYWIKPDKEHTPKVAKNIENGCYW